MTVGPDTADQLPEPVHTGDARAAAASPKRLALLAVALLAASAVGLAVWAIRSVLQTASTEVTIESATAPVATGAQPGKVAPPFEVPGYDGRPVRLAAFRGHPVVLNFWASWCVPCQQEARNLESAYETFRSQGVVFVGVDMQADTWDESRKFLHKYGITYPQGRDETGVVGRTYRVTSIPTTYFIGDNGRILSTQFVGGFVGDQGARDLGRKIEQLLLGPPILQRDATP